jgi:hypothetical protein
MALTTGPSGPGFLVVRRAGSVGMMRTIPERAWAWLRRRSALALLVVTLSGLVAGGLARLAGAGAIADAAWLASAACGLGYAVWSAASSSPAGDPWKNGPPSGPGMT